MTIGTEPLIRSQLDVETTTTTTTSPDVTSTDKYTQFLFLLVSSILCLAALMCVARIIFIYCSYRRRRDEERRHTQLRAVNLEAELDNAFRYPPLRPDVGATNYGFTDPPPRYENLFKRDEPPPVYESVRHSRAPVASPRLPFEQPEVERVSEAASPVRIEDVASRIPVPHAGSSPASDTEEIPHAFELDIRALSQRIQSNMDTARELCGAGHVESDAPPVSSSGNDPPSFSTSAPS
ncbi:hypothetical protein Q1695_015964 [Nippostrongylus brasiliensis]|nr:hypothetical protein Q1695_015964 [Nippostrongylus brasiliensis]